MSDGKTAAKPRGRASKAKTSKADTSVAEAADAKSETPKVAALADSEAPATSGPLSEDDDDGEPRRGGWWQRTFG